MIVYCFPGDGSPDCPERIWNLFAVKCERITIFRGQIMAVFDLVSLALISDNLFGDEVAFLHIFFRGSDKGVRLCGFWCALSQTCESAKCRKKDPRSLAFIIVIPGDFHKNAAIGLRTK